MDLQISSLVLYQFSYSGSIAGIGLNISRISRDPEPRDLEFQGSNTDSGSNFSLGI